MVHRIYVEKVEGADTQARELARELACCAGIGSLRSVRLLTRYDLEGLSPEGFEQAVAAVLCDPRTDRLCRDLRPRAQDRVLALEALPGQYDQRADAAAQCIQALLGGEAPRVRTARILVLEGELTPGDLDAARRWLLNPVESREASPDLPETLAQEAAVPPLPPVLDGFRALDAGGLAALRQQLGLAMEEDDLAVCAAYFAGEGRDPSLTELRVLDTYWSDHCRHTTFLTRIASVACEDPVIARTLSQYHDLKKELGGERPFTLMDVATIAASVLKARGRLPQLDETEERNACSIRVRAQTPGGEEDWVLFFKNETHNHPTEIEPFGGAATCIGGAIRDPLSARAYVYAGMRVTGGADPGADPAETLAGKLPQRVIAREAARGFSSYANQAGLPAGQVWEFYHPGYAAKRLEAGAVLGAAPAASLRREAPLPGDVVLLVGGRTGRDGCGGATGSSLAHGPDSADVFAAQVQKGNAPEGRKLQRLLSDPRASLLIKRANDFGAGGVSVAIGELAPGQRIELDRVPVKYPGLDATELAISESQERMAVVVEKRDAQAFMALAEAENLEATPVAVVTAEARLVMRWRGHTVADLDRGFLDASGARKVTHVVIERPDALPADADRGFREGLLRLARDLAGCSRQGLARGFDSTAGAATVLYPFGGKNLLTPPCAMVHALPVPGGTDSCSFMAFGFDPDLSRRDPYRGGWYAVAEAVCRLVAAGAPLGGIYLSHQEYFPRPGQDPGRWGLPLASLLGALRAQMELEAAAIGGKDSMSGSFGELDVPPTLISFAVAAGRAQDAVSPEFKRPGSRVAWLRPRVGPDGLPEASSLRALLQEAQVLLKEKKALSCQAAGAPGVAHAAALMALGNGIGLRFARQWSTAELFTPAIGSLILEMAPGEEAGETLGYTTREALLVYRDESLELRDFLAAYQGRLESVYPLRAQEAPAGPVPLVSSGKTGGSGPRVVRPRALVPVFPGTSSEKECVRALEEAGAQADILVFQNRTPGQTEDSVRELARRIRDAQILLLPGGMVTGDEPDGGGKFVGALLRRPPVAEALLDFLRRQGLLGGIGGGFQALLRCGLLPHGPRGLTQDGAGPALTGNAVGRYQSDLVRVRVASRLSPWFGLYEAGQCRVLPVSSGEGRLFCGEDLLRSLADGGQILSQYVDADGAPSMDSRHNPFGSAWGVEALCSPDGLVMGRMGHAERALPGLYANAPATGRDPMFRAAVRWFD